MRLHKLLLLLAALALAVPLWAADTYEIDPAHTSVGFSISHMVLSKVKGTFNEFSGTLTYDEQAQPPITTVNTTIQAASIDTRNKQRDDHLRSPDFFAVEQHPDLTFVAKTIAKTDQGWVANGTLTIHGVAKEIALPFKVNGPIKDPGGKMRLGIEAATTINRKDFGITWNKALETGGLVVGEDVHIEIQAEYVKR